MSKSNVNPNYYKVAGRERQGEAIAQDRNKQTHAENLVLQRTENRARARTPAPQDGNASPDGGPTPSATAARKTRAAPLQPSPGRKRGHNLVPGSTGPHARLPKAAPRAARRPGGAAPQLPPKQATKKARVTRQGSVTQSRRSAAQ